MMHVTIEGIMLLNDVITVRINIKDLTEGNCSLRIVIGALGFCLSILNDRLEEDMGAERPLEREKVLKGRSHIRQILFFKI